MSELHKHIPSEETNSYSKIFIHPLGKDKQQKEKGNGSLATTTAIQSQSLLTQYLRTLTTFLPFQQSEACLSFLDSAMDHVIAFRKLLVKLAGDDLSQNVQFCEQLSQLWHKLLDDCNRSSSKQPFSLEIFNKIQFFTLQIKNFPVHHDHSLGYYLSHDIGPKWAPLPCIKLLQDLHQEFSVTPRHSTLHNWILLLDNILLAAARK